MLVKLYQCVVFEPKEFQFLFSVKSEQPSVKFNFLELISEPAEVSLLTLDQFALQDSTIFVDTTNIT